MRAIINGCLYDTEKSDCIGKWDDTVYDKYGQPQAAPFLEEVLYQNSKGAYFLCSTTLLELHGGIEDVVKLLPVTENKARIWIMKKLDADAYCARFGEPEEAEPLDETHSLHQLLIENALFNGVKKMANEKQVSVDSLIEDAVRKTYLDKSDI